MRRPGALVVCMLVGVSTLGMASRSEPLADDWIVFGSFRGGDFSGSIHAVRADGTGERELSIHRGGRPASLDPWSAPDESLILFTRGGSDHRSSVWALDPVAGEERRATSEVMVRFNSGRAWPSSRPDHPGDFVYVREGGGGRSVVIGSLAGGPERDLGAGEFPAWSPDGARLAYVRDATVWLQTPGADDARPIGGPLAGMSYPSWSSTGEFLLVSGSEGDGPDLYEIDLDGSVQRRLTYTPDIAEAAARWSPDGRRVAFSAAASEPADGWQHSIYVLDVATGAIREVTTGRFHDTRPTWTVRSLP